MMSDFLGAKGPTILGNALHNSWYLLVQILRELRRAPPRVLRIMQIISRLGRSLPPSICRHFHYSHAHYPVHVNLPKESLCGHFVNHLILSDSLSPLSSKSTREPRAISHQFNRSTHRPTNQPHFSSVNQSMPTHQQITAACEQGSDADATTTIRVGQPTGAGSSRIHCLSSIYRDPRQDLHDATIASALLNGKLNWFGDCRPRLGIPRVVLIMHQRCLMICRATQSMATTFIGPME